MALRAFFLACLVIFGYSPSLPAQSEESIASQAKALTADGVPKLRLRAQSGDVQAQVLLGYVYQEGRIVSRDLAEAARWYVKAANQADPTARTAVIRLASHFRHYVNDAQKWGYRDEDGNILISPRFDDAWNFSQGLAAVRVGSKCGYIDLSGSFVLQPRYDACGDFSEDGTAVSVEPEGNSGFIYRDGRFFISPRFHRAQSFFEGLAAAEPEPLDGWGFIDKSGQFVIPPNPQFRMVERFSEGLAAVAIKKGVVEWKWGYIDKSGNMVIPAQFDEAFPFSGGRAKVQFDSKWYYIDRNGKIL